MVAGESFAAQQKSEFSWAANMAYLWLASDDYRVQEIRRR